VCSVLPGMAATAATVNIQIIILFDAKFFNKYINIKNICAFLLRVA
jgi:hypothetical protein